MFKSQLLAQSRVALLSLPLFVFSACGRHGGGAFDARGYANEKLDYHVLGPSNALLGEEWQLDNFYQRRPGSAGDWIQKDANQYLADYELDLDGDGKPDKTHHTYLYDLRWTHRRHEAVIWLRTFPISRNMRDRELRVLMQGYIDEVAGAGYERVNIQSSRVDVLEKRFAAAQLDRGTARIAGLDAFISTVDVVNVDQEKITPGQNRTRVRLALMRMPQEVALIPQWANATFPVLMIAGYANLPNDFDTELAGFDRLLGSIEVNGKRGFEDLKLESLKPQSDTSADAISSGAAERGTDGTPTNPDQSTSTSSGLKD